MSLLRPSLRLIVPGLGCVALSLPLAAAASDTTGADDDFYWTDVATQAPMSWVDISGDGTDLGLGAGADTTLTLPFSFPFYGSSWSQITVSAYGVVVLGAGTGPGAWSSGQCVGDGTVSSALIAPAWGTWDLSLGGTVYSRSTDEGVIIEWQDVYADSGDSSTQSFGLILFPSGEIAFTYQNTTSGVTATARGRGTAIGVQDAAGDGVAISCDESAIAASDDTIYLTPWGVRTLAGTYDVDEVANATIEGASASDRFGYTLAPADDVNGDGLDDLLVAAPYADDGATNAGVVYLFSGGDLSGTVSSTDAVATVTGVGRSDNIGTALAGGADVDGDGFPDVLIGAPFDDQGDTNAGAAALFKGVNLAGSQTWDETAALLSGEDANDYAGRAVALVDDVNGDGYADMVVGAPNEDSGGSNAGMAYLVLGSASPADTELGSADATWYGEAADDYAGYSVTSIGDVDGDGYGDFAIGAYGNDDGGTDAGAVYIVPGDLSPSGSQALSALDQITGETAGDAAGISLAAAGDLSDDGLDDFFVGAYTHGSTNSGAAYTVAGTSSTWPAGLGSVYSQVEGAGTDRLGAALTGLDLSGDGELGLVSGAYGNSDGGSAAGALYLLDGDTLSLGAVDVGDAQGMVTGNIASGYLGAALTTGDYDGAGTEDIAVGAWGADGAATASGLVYIIPSRPTYPDADGDGHIDTALGGMDCDDDDASRWPGATELCDGIDNDCDDQIDEGYDDTDGDGTADCMDTEECDGLDNDGDGSVDEGMSDSDGDGICDALDTEQCDGLDNDGDGLIDEDFEDNDGDGIADCVDGEDCDGLDNDGDGSVDEGYADTDGDGTADCVDTEECDGLDNDGDGLIDEGTPDTDHDGTPDCVDTEECDGLDNDGDGLVDEDFIDTDGDGAADCIDVEECDGVDNNGDGLIDEGFVDTDGDGTADCVDSTPAGEANTPEVTPAGCGCAHSRAPSGLALLLLPLLALRRRRAR